MVDKTELLLCGFFGRGNAGDEALLQCIYETFYERHEIVLCVDEHGAYPGFWDWYPYKHCRIIHQGNLAFALSASRLAGVLVGGGGLPAGFALSHVFSAKARGVPCALVGTDGLPRLKHNQPYLGVSIKAIKDLYDVVAPRTAAATERMSAVEVEAVYGADWAMHLAADVDGLQPAPREIVVTVRELATEAVSDQDIAEVRGLVDGLRTRGFEPVWLPFSPEDERFLTEQNLSERCPMHRCWWNPQRVKGHIQQAFACLSVGRLHPLIFAATARVRVAAVATGPWSNTKPEGNRLDKIDTMLEELGITRYATALDALEGLDRQEWRAADIARVALASERLRVVKRELHHLFDWNPGPAVVAPKARPRPWV
jgi:polysaccharide pyruvyl transferase WcaK-like protein